MSTTTAIAGELRLALDSIRVRTNVRDLDPEHVDALAQSIKLRGLLVPLIVRPVADGHELVAGYHRIAACRKLGLTDAPVVVREHEGSSADSAAENVTRLQLDHLQEARAVQAMLDEGYTLDGAAQALGWSPRLVSARAKILRLPAAAQQLVGTGEIPVSAIDNLLAILDVSPAIADAVVLSIVSGDVAGPQLARDPGWTIGRALHHAPKGTFGAYLNHIDARELPKLRLGKKIDALVDEATTLHKRVDQHAYGPPTFRFTEADVDQARAAGVLLEFAEGRNAIVCDHALYRELAKQAITRTVTQLRERAAAKGKRTAAADKRARTPREQLDVEHRANLRELARQAHGVNLDLGAALLTDLAIVDPDDIDVAKFFALGLLGPATSNYLGTGDHVARTLAANGLRLVLDEHRTTTTRMLKSGGRGKTKVAYGDVDDALKWLLRFVDGAKTAGELYGRVLVVFAAQHYASQLVLANSKRASSRLPRSAQDKASKAFEQITRKVLPASHKALQRALDAEARTYAKHIDELDKTGRADDDVDAVVEQAVENDELGEDLDGDDAGAMSELDDSADGRDTSD